MTWHYLLPYNKYAIFAFHQEAKITGSRFHLYQIDHPYVKKKALNSRLSYFEACEFFWPTLA